MRDLQRLDHVILAHLEGAEEPAPAEGTGTLLGSPANLEVDENTGRVVGDMHVEEMAAKAAQMRAEGLLNAVASGDPAAGPLTDGNSDAGKGTDGDDGEGKASRRRRRQRPS